MNYLIMDKYNNIFYEGVDYDDCIRNIPDLSEKSSYRVVILTDEELDAYIESRINIAETLNYE